MLEAKEGCALLEHVDEQTFVRFSQYAYTGDYLAADPDILLDSSMIASAQPPSSEAPIDDGIEGRSPPGPSSPQLARLATVPPEPVLNPVVANYDNWGFSIPQNKKKKKKAKLAWSDEDTPVPQVSQSKRSKLWDEFKNIGYTISMPTVQPRKNSEPCEDYTEVFLCHARLYVFADKYDVGPLRQLSLHKLQRTLADFALYDQRLHDIVQLIRYSYSNTTDHTGSIDDLRLLVVRYSACMVDELSQSAEFQLILEETGALGRDLIKEMLKRLD